MNIFFNELKPYYNIILNAFGVDFTMVKNNNPISINNKEDEFRY